jgi:hypothetical protein
MTARVLDPQACSRLIKLCGMLGSNAPGERAAAGLKADQLLKANGLHWGDVICVPCTETEPPPPDDLDDDYAVDWGCVIDFCWERGRHLNDKEFGFVDSMRSWDGFPTERQRRWLRDIARRLKGARR